jgi:RNA polymerase-binding protein DksA
MRKIHLDSIKRRLLAERKYVEETLQRNTEILAEVDDSTRDAGDLSTASHDRGLLYSLNESAASRFKAIDEALSRLEADDYGECRRCGAPISPGRLEAIPWAANCRSCQEIADAQGPAPVRPENIALSERRHDAA